MPLRITYCTNIHAGETWEETFSSLRAHIPEVKASVSPNQTFPIGLRLSNRAALEITDKVSSMFLEWCREHDCYVATINGFPYGSFHSAYVKENVYLPDWRDPERAEYTRRLAALLDAWMPEGRSGSISTVPIGFKKHITEGDSRIIRQNILRVLEHLDRLRQKGGKRIVLSFEPEPGCVLETAGDAVTFFSEMEFPDELRDGAGICFDCCHHAVEFEDPVEAFTLLAGSGIRMGKIQVSSGLRLAQKDRAILKRFAEPCYLHQVVIKRGDGTLLRYNDLGDALALPEGGPDDEWRVHFHLPLFIDRTETFSTTRDFTEKVLSLVSDPAAGFFSKGQDILSGEIILEVETYTWDVLPAELQAGSVTDSIIREIQWVQSQISR